LNRLTKDVTVMRKADHDGGRVLLPLLIEYLLPQLHHRHVM
jgi:hypothetical protein